MTHRMSGNHENNSATAAPHVAQVNTTTTTTSTSSSSSSSTYSNGSNSSSSSSNCSNDSICCSNSSKCNAATKSATANKNLWQFVCLVSVCVACYCNSLQCGLVFDDISAIRDNKDLRGNTPLTNIFFNDFWGTPMHKEQSHKSYRPLTVLTFRLNYWLHELAPFGYHLGNLLLHIVVCLLWRRVCRRLLQHCAGAEMQREQVHECSFVAALLFAVHPIHTEAVTGVVGRAELLSSICYLAAFLTYARAVSAPAATVPAASRRLVGSVGTRAALATRWLLLSGGFGSWLLASMLCKEQGITIAGVCATYELFVVQQLRPVQLWHLLQQLFEEQRQPGARPAAVGQSSPLTKAAPAAVCWSATLIKRLTFLVGITLALLVGRVYVMGSQLPVFTRFDNPAAAADTPARQLTFSYLIYLNIWLLLFPCDLCCDWTMGE